MNNCCKKRKENRWENKTSSQNSKYKLYFLPWCYVWTCYNTGRVAYFILFILCFDFYHTS